MSGYQVVCGSEPLRYPFFDCHAKANIWYSIWELGAAPWTAAHALQWHDDLPTGERVSQL